MARQASWFNQALAHDESILNTIIVDNGCDHNDRLLIAGLSMLSVPDQFAIFVDSLDPMQRNAMAYTLSIYKLKKEVMFRF